ncbi:hypothetical protein [Caldimonas brevitalea]|uniref:Uncharacterized protein n=1 Tax=Caldimonas brevitalea TaxID=413882 RepID=A0A0G3BVY7_9BURK|nr:hypothetical protein [Caldimonas brevitalea]AKJ31536.1 hypothetical protein AAW51_4845 [Caldimonas brevitalea]
MSDPLHWSLVYAKTEAGRRAFEQRSFAGNRAQRSLFILLDGRQPLKRLLAALRSLGLTGADVEALQRWGYIEPVSGAEPPAAGPEAPKSASVRTPQRSLAAAKFYALEQIGLLLGHADAPLRDAARQVADREALLAWLQDCRARIAAAGGDERARLFFERCVELLPEARAMAAA